MVAKYRRPTMLIYIRKLVNAKPSLSYDLQAKAASGQGIVHQVSVQIRRNNFPLSASSVL